MSGGTKLIIAIAIVAIVYLLIENADIQGQLKQKKADEDGFKNRTFDVTFSSQAEPVRSYSCIPDGGRPALASQASN